MSETIPEPLLHEPGRWGAPVDPVRCYGCGGMFEPYTNEKFCSDDCHDAYPDEWPKTRC